MAGHVARIKDFYEVLLGARPQAEAPAGFTAPGAAGVAPRTSVPAPDTVRLPKLIAFYLPQYHPIPENDLWWGAGFTEWRTWDGHSQLRRSLPATHTGGSRVLRPARPEVMEQQADLAKAYGIHGFCFYYYWFDGRRLLEMPVDQLLARGRPDFPFCLCWANENWTRRWDGSEDEILMGQDYSEGYAERFIRELSRSSMTRGTSGRGRARSCWYTGWTFSCRGRRGAPVAAQSAPEEGIPDIHLAAVQSFGIGDPRPFGFDAAVDFPPDIERALLDPRQ